MEREGQTQRRASYRLKLPVSIVLVRVACDIAVHANADVTDGDTAHAVVLNGHPIGDGLQDLILYFDHLTVSVGDLGVLHGVGGDHLVQVIVDDAELAELLDAARHVHVAVQVDRKRGLVNHSLHASDSEVVVAVVEASIHQPLFTESENLPAD